ncbi:alpha/beta hydrolase [Flavobacterium columnare]|uniref:alpha/beta hydrolase n=1 Tax=Flavobacterium columnare TaxID=996 RepID=UPI0033984B4B
MHDPRVGRFFAIDPLFKDYPYYTPYQFSGNRVIDAVELEGKETFFVHGTIFYNPILKVVGLGGEDATFMFKRRHNIVKDLPKYLGNSTSNISFKWTGYNSDQERHIGAENLANYILGHRKPGEPISIVGHSHGGNIAIEAANILVRDHKISANEITIVAINTPLEDDIELKYKDVTLYTINNPSDLIQNTGSDHWYGGTTEAKRTTKIYKNVDSTVYYEDKIESDITELFFDVGHVGPSDINFKEWFKILKEEVEKNKKTKEFEEKEKKERTKSSK